MLGAPGFAQQQARPHSHLQASKVVSGARLDKPQISLGARRGLNAQAVALTL
jgi:hypothetical protein